MIQTFRDAGYRVEGGFTDGVMRLVFPIDATDTSVNVMQAREHRAEAASIQTLLRRVERRRHRRVPQARHDRPDAGAQPGARRLPGPRVRREPRSPVGRRPPGVRQRSRDIPDSVDIAIVAVPADSVHDVVLDCAAKGVHGLVVISSGFAETGEEGRKRQRQLVGLARSYGLRLIGPNALGIINTARGLLPQRLAVDADAAAGARRVLLPVRCARRRDPREGRPDAGSGSPRSSVPATVPTSPATTCCSTGRRTTTPRSCCSTSSRSATRASSAGSRGGSRSASP